MDFDGRQTRSIGPVAGGNYYTDFIPYIGPDTEIYRLEMGCHTPRKVVAALYTKPPWIHVLVRTDEKWKRAYVLREANRMGHCLVSVTSAPEADPIMVPLSTIRIPTRRRVAKRTRDTRPYRRIKKLTADVEGQQERLREVDDGEASAASTTPDAVLGAPNIKDAGMSSSGHNHDQDHADV